MTEQIVETETKDATVVVQRVVSQPLKSVWQRLMTPQGNAVLLGEGGRLGDKGDSWEAADGRYGVTRSFHPMEQIRFSWHAGPAAPRTLVDVRLLPEGDASTRIEVHHQHVTDDMDADALEASWADVLGRLDTAE